MKQIKPLQEQPVALHAVSLDLRSPAGKTQDGYFRLIVNALSDTQGKTRRIGGWKKLNFAGGTNEDLHDQLLTNAVAPVASYSMPTLRVTPPTFNPGATGAGSVTTVEVTLTAPGFNPLTPAYWSPSGLSVTAPSFGAVAAYSGRLYEVLVRTTEPVSDADPGWVELSFYSTTTGNAVARFYTDGTHGEGENISAYGCAPATATAWANADFDHKCSMWNTHYSDFAFNAPIRLTYTC